MNITEIAKSHIGQDEIPHNVSFVDPTFLKRMQSAGFYSGAPWCGFFCRMVWLEAKTPIHTSTTPIITMVTSSAVKSMKAAARAKRFETYPVPGSVVVWRSFRNNKPLSTGHMGIVTEVDITAWSLVNGKNIPIYGSFNTVEGNTTKFGEREGKTVATRIRSFQWYRTDGLRLMGFIHPLN
jgi:hypothetical protein